MFYRMSISSETTPYTIGHVEVGAMLFLGAPQSADKALPRLEFPMGHRTKSLPSADATTNQAALRLGRCRDLAYKS